MSYSATDLIISEWAAKHGLTVYTEYKGEEVRSIDMVSEQGKKYQIWIDKPGGGDVTVHAWDYKKRRQDWVGTLSKLAQNLEEAIQTVKSWMA